MTLDQITAILSLLFAFGVPQMTIDQVRLDITPPPAIVAPTSVTPPSSVQTPAPVIPAVISSPQVTITPMPTKTAVFNLSYAAYHDEVTNPQFRVYTSDTLDIAKTRVFTCVGEVCTENPALTATPIVQNTAMTSSIGYIDENGNHKIADMGFRNDFSIPPVPGVKTIKFIFVNQAGVETDSSYVDLI